MDNNNSRQSKIEEQIREVSAKFIERESNKTSIISVTGVSLFEKGRKATIFITVLPESGEDSAVNFLKRKRPEIKDAIKKGLNLNTIPFIEIEIDKGEKARQNIDVLLRKDS